MSRRILVVDDEAPMRAFLARNLAARGYDVLTAATGHEALALLRTEHPDLVVLDIMMPTMDGLEACGRIRDWSDVPIIVVSALDDESDIVTALDAGADDHLGKPFGVDELMARVRSALRRANVSDGAARGDRLVHEGLVVDVEAQRAWLDDVPVPLTRTELAVLTVFMQHAGKTLSHDFVLQRVWGPGFDDQAHYVRIYVGRLRTKLESDTRVFFTTEHGIGYRLGT